MKLVLANILLYLGIIINDSFVLMKIVNWFSEPLIGFEYELSRLQAIIIVLIVPPVLSYFLGLGKGSPKIENMPHVDVFAEAVARAWLVPYVLLLPLYIINLIITYVW